MKNLKLILPFVIVMAVVMYSCKKEIPGPPNTDEEALMTHSQNVLSLIHGFDAKLESSLKTGELLELDSAVWYTEALQNYDYAHPDSGSRDFIVFKTHYTLVVNPAGFVLMDDVEALYSQMEIQLAADLAVISDPVKFLIITDVALDSTIGNTAHLSVSNGLGAGELIIYDPFEEDDDWIWGTLGEDLGTPPAGLCDPEADYVASDGSNELAYRLNNPNMSSPPADGYTDIVIKDADGTGEYEGRLYVDWTHDIDYCLTNTKLTYYLNESDGIIYTYEGQGGERPQGKNFISVEIVDTMIPSGNPYPYVHWYHITYGKPYVFSTE